ncbi:MAG TPA: methyltransferase domain-containing protein [Candidatus Dormibacteraeota bacterium]|nr:methyltransferase domain-containing protein [Candidatus Dormibacteraeota bacterium]
MRTLLQNAESPVAATDRQANLDFYESLWERAHLVEAERFNTWPLIQRLCAAATRRLEVAPGLRLHLPLAGTQFVELSAAAVAVLRERHAAVVRGSITALPLASACFDLVCAFDIVEHVDDDDAALAELARVTAPAGALVLSTPLHPARWTPFDAIVGHRRRFEPAPLVAKLRGHGLAVEASAPFGMQPRAPWLTAYGMAQLQRHRARALWWYNHVIMPLGLRLQGPLTLQPGVLATADIDEALFVCRKST